MPLFPQGQCVQRETQLGPLAIVMMHTKVYKAGHGNICLLMVLIHFTNLVLSVGGSETQPSFCNLPWSSGSDCGVVLERFYYNPVFRDCRQLVYLGCGGNANRFETQAECETTCGHGQG